MTPEQALNNLDGAVSQISLTRQQHIILAQSVDVLSKAIQEHKIIDLHPVQDPLAE